MKQTSLFDFALEEYEKEIQEEKPKEEPTDYRQYNVCPKCKVYPVERFIKETKGGVSPHWYIVCPICGYSCSTHYDRFEHWNTCNYYRVRDGKI